MIKKALDEIQIMVSGNGLGASFNNTFINGVSIDSRTCTKGNLYVPIVRIKDGHTFIDDAIEKGASACLWEKSRPNPPKKIPVIFVEDTKNALQNLARSYREQLTAKVIGVTGSNGKTTTKDMIHSILSTKFKVYKTKGNLNSEYGLPLSLLSVSENDEIVVLELGMSNRGEIETLSKIAQPDIGVITMIGTSHIATLGSRKAIANAKLEIIAGIRQNGLLSIYGDEELLIDTLKDIENKEIRITTFGITNKNDIYQTNVKSNARNIEFTINTDDNHVYSINLIGKHNINNALAAISVAKELGMSDKQIKIGLKKLSLTGMRMEEIKSDEGFTIINDAWNASPTSVQAAIETFNELTGYNRKILVLGDMLELGQNEVEYHKEIGYQVAQSKIDFLFTLGKLAKYIAEETQRNHGSKKVKTFLDKQSLITQVRDVLEPNDVILVKGSRGMALEDIVNALIKNNN
ncbi:UDP-N-acetylmuramoyl-tripeptide--D-alanyl-D-alanine ligase [Bacillus sp. MUM 13]|uniref:UDP-N-acetylmuramoyl-tripeptide--D-alanyl-D- alanine ligase n=1 Tax=Bacillus sp. MUM 13 TaxID=1678001 RepID=UPI0008F5CEB8|nr:UDP-N-acetylmuramoyl-tripeptide--D-alanyl-D-alanine ligase [Bacillus sp. MUM 13]OIK12337.1 UDP-N-acetylmuramoyl-tripeptide--D-alanyl-D-alanine ligase [Bacillus sp. MUM 13]